jgi:protein-tyrosine phosphatase
LGKLRTYDLVVGGVQARLMKLRAVFGSRPNTNKITENVWVGGANNPRLVVSQNFNVVFNLREIEDLKYQNFLMNHGLEYVNVKIPDRYGASPEVLSQIVALIDEKVSEGRKVLVHCNLGRGRSALVVAAYLVSHGLSPEEALKKIKEKRNVTYLNERQRQALSDFADTLSSSFKRNS